MNEIMVRQSATAERIPMSWEEYERLGDDVLGEYIDGALVVSPTPVIRHEEICMQLARNVGGSLPAGVVVFHGAGWFVDGNEFIPDLIVADHPGRVHRITRHSILGSGGPVIG